MSAHGILSLGLGAVFVSVMLLTLALGRAMSERRQVERSLESVRGMSLQPSVAAPPPVGSSSFILRVIGPMTANLSGVARRLLPGDIGAKVARRLDVAGNPEGWDVDRVLGFKVTGLVLAAMFGLFVGHSSPVKAVLFAGIGAAVGFWVPDVLLYNQGIKRQQVIQKTLADALDMLTISVEAGLGFDAALSQVAKNTEGPLAGEFFRVLQEMQIGKGRTEAFRAVLDRTDVADLRSFISAVIQADTFGIPIARVLRTQAQEMRLKRRQTAEEKAQKVPVKMMVPLVLCILPALFIVVIGPGALSIMRSFSHS